MIKYKTGDYDQLIKPVEVIRETAQFVILKGWRKGQHEQRISKSGWSGTYHSSFEDARTHLINEQKERRKRLQNKIPELEKEIEDTKNLLIPDTEKRIAELEALTPPSEQ